jgi:hypothetical protein
MAAGMEEDFASCVPPPNTTTINRQNTNSSESMMPTMFPSVARQQRGNKHRDFQENVFSFEEAQTTS